MITIPLELSDEQIHAIAVEVAKIKGLPDRDAFSINEVAERIGVSSLTVRRRVTAGIIPVLPGIKPPRIPANYVAQMLDHKPNG